jgi:hypothetical protein
MVTEVAAKPPVSIALAKRIKVLRKAYLRVLRRKPNTLEKAAIGRATLMTARAEEAADDPDVSLEDIVRLDHSAHRARRDLYNLIGHPKRRPEVAPPDPGKEFSAIAWLRQKEGQEL